jgi:hypothetical protein
MKITKEQLIKIERSKHRRELVAAGVYDGRFRQRTVIDKRFKQPKHKLQIIEDDGN